MNKWKQEKNSMNIWKHFVIYCVESGTWACKKVYYAGSFYQKKQLHLQSM